MSNEIKNGFPASCLKIDSSYTKNKTFDLGLAIAHRFLTEAHPVSSFYNLSLPRAIGEKRKTDKKVINSSQIAPLSSSILNLKFKVEVEAVKEEAYCVTDCETLVITINKKFAEMVLTADDDSHHALAFLLGVKLTHEFAHLVMFWLGYGGKKTSAGFVPKTPPMFMRESGHEWEAETFQGILGHYHRKTDIWKFSILSWQMPYESFYPLTNRKFITQFSLSSFYSKCKSDDFFPEVDQDDASSSNSKSALVVFDSGVIHSGDTELVPFVSAPCKRDH